MPAGSRMCIYFTVRRGGDFWAKNLSEGKSPRVETPRAKLVYGMSEFGDRTHSLFLFLFPGDAHLIVSICIVNAAFHAGSREPCCNRRDKRFHPVQQERQAKVTLEPEESVGGSGKRPSSAHALEP